MDPAVLVAIIAGITSLVGSLAGAFLNNKLQQYRLEQIEKKIEVIPELEKEAQDVRSDMEREVQSVKNKIENETQAIHSELDSFTHSALERRKVVEGLEQDVDMLKGEVNKLNTRIALIESEIKNLEKLGN